MMPGLAAWLQQSFFGCRSSGQIEANWIEMGYLQKMEKKTRVWATQDGMGQVMKILAICAVVGDLFFIVCISGVERFFGSGIAYKMISSMWVAQRAKTLVNSSE